MKTGVKLTTLQDSYIRFELSYCFLITTLYERAKYMPNVSEESVEALRKDVLADRRVARDIWLACGLPIPDRISFSE